MPPTATGTAEDAPRRSRYVAHRAAPSGELAAAAAVTALLAELLLAQVTLALSLCLLIIGRSGRWRPMWLAAPAVLGLAWMLTAGVRPTLAGYLAGGGHVIGYLTGSGSVITRLAHLSVAFGGWRQWLPRQLPAALIVAAAQTACLRSLGVPGRRREYRAGLIIAARRAYLAAVVRGGEMATSDGGCVGIARSTGRRAAITWREAASGVLCTGQDAVTVAATGRELLLAAIQRRKTVIIVDLAGGRDRGDGDGGLAASIARECADCGAPLRHFGSQGECYDPLPGSDPARASGLLLAMIDWRGASGTQRRFCADYANAALTVIAATTAGPPAQPVAVIDELTGLLSPGALGARLRRVPGHLLGLDSLTRRAADLSGQLDNDPALVTPLATQLTGLRSGELGRWLRPARGAGPAGFAGPASPADMGNVAGRASPRRPGTGETPISLRRALANREVVLFALDRRLHGRSAIMIARLVAADLTATLAERGAVTAPADCAVWISGCEAFDPHQLTALIAAGAGTETAVLLGTAAESAATRLAGDVNVVVVRGPAPQGLAGLLGSRGPAWSAHDQLAAAPSGWFISPDSGQIGSHTMPENGPGLPERFSFETNGHSEVLAAELLGQRPDELSLLVRSPQRRTVVRATAAR